MPGLIHNLTIALLKIFPLPDPMALGLSKKIVVRQDPTKRQIRKYNISTDSFEGQNVYTYGPPKNGEPLLYYCHGGGFISGMIGVYYDAVGRLNHRLGAPIICPDYPMPPETDAHGVVKYTAAHFRKILAEYPDSPIIISGDSAGGHLTMALTQALTAEERSRVSAIFPLFPGVNWNPDKKMEFHKQEVLLKEELMGDIAARFMGEFEFSDPVVSPIYGDLTGLPTVHIHSGDKDPLYGDSVALEEKLKQTGQPHSHTVHKGYGHDYFLFFPTPDGRRALKDYAEQMKAAF